MFQQGDFSFSFCLFVAKKREGENFEHSLDFTVCLFIYLCLCCPLQDIKHVYYETEIRTEWCQSNSTFVPCFLFARKFSRGAAVRLLTEGVVGPFDATSLLLASTTWWSSDLFLFILWQLAFRSQGPGSAAYVPQGIVVIDTASSFTSEYF